MSNRDLIHFDAFSGFGGFALAAQWTGAIQTVAFCEIEPYPCRVLNKNFPGIPILGDITKLGNSNLDPFRPVDIFTGGFPCQPYSIAGKRRGDEDDRALWREMLRVIEILKPTWIVGENVANFVNMALDAMLTDLDRQGYEAIPFVIPAAGVGAWHRRDRTIVVGYSSRSGLARTRRDRFTNGGKDMSHPYGESLERVAIAWQERDTWSVEPELGRVANGVPNRVERLRGLGNAVVPQQVYPILQAIVDIEKSRIPQ